MSTSPGQAAKDKGNAAFKAGDYPAAIGHYTAAIIANSAEPTYFLNRAAAYLKLGKNEDAERDCTTVLKLDEKNVKALFRRGQARVALQKLHEAEADFRQALKLDPANDAAKQELKKVEDLLKTQSKPRTPRLPADIPSLAKPGAASPPTPSSPPPAPKRRRIPIEIIEPPSPGTSTRAATSSPTSASAELTEVSSRPLHTTASAISAVSSTPPSAQEPPQKPPVATPAATFKDAKESRDARENLGTASTTPRVRGGIFRPDGSHTMFGLKDAVPSGAAGTSASDTSSPASSSTSQPKSPSAAAKSTPGAAPLRRVDLSKSASAGVKAPMSLFTFQQRWEQLESVEARWALINEIPSPALPALFQSSLDASLLSSILSTFLSILRSSPINAVGEADPTLSAEDMRVRVRAYLVWLARVPRFGTVVLFMSPDERRLVQDVWSAVGVGVVKKGAGAMAVEGDTKEVEEGRKAWGAS